MSRLITFVIGCLLLFAVSAEAVVPHKVNFQSRLLDSDGNPVADGDYPVTFSIFTQASDGTIVWTETATVQTQDGLFTHYLGSVDDVGNPLLASYFDDYPSLFLQVEISGETVAPRTQLISVPYAAKAEYADVAQSSLSSLPDADWVVDGNNMYSGVTGNIGIKESNPSADLHVHNADARILVQGSGDNVGIALQSTGGSAHRYDIVSTSFADGGAGRLKIKDVTLGVDRFIIDPNGNIFLGDQSSPTLLAMGSGNVGIGHNNPTERLEVVGNASVSGVVMTDTISSNSPLLLQTGSTTRMYIDDVTGNIGIRESNPSADLHVHNADARILVQGSGDNVGIALQSTGGSAHRYDVVSTSFADGGAGRLKIKDVTLGVDRFIIDPNGNIFLGDQSSPTLLAMGSGNVGIGHNNPGNILTIQQNSSTDPIADSWTVYSSRRWKENVKTISDAVEKVKRLRGVEYDWKVSGIHDVGLIAEEVGKVIPEIVQYEDDGVDAKSVDYSRLVAVLIEGMKEQQDQIDALKERVNQLTNRLNGQSGL